MRVALLANLRFLSGQVMGKVTNQIIYLPDARDVPRGVLECPVDEYEPENVKA